MRLPGSPSEESVGTGGCSVDVDLAERLLGRAHRAPMAVALFAVVLAACGETPPVQTLDPAAEERQPRAHVAVHPVVAQASDTVTALAAAYLAAVEIADDPERSDALRDVEARIRAAGADGARALLFVGGKSRFDLDADLLASVGVESLGPICDALEDPAYPAAAEVVLALAKLMPVWKHGSHAARVTGRLVAVAATYDGGSGDGALTDAEILADEARSGLVVAAVGQLSIRPELAAPHAGELAALVVRWRELDADRQAIDAVVKVLMSLGPMAAPALPVLLEASGTDPAMVLRLAERVGSASPESLPSLLGFLDDGDWHVRCAAIHALGAWGDACPEARDALPRMLHDQHVRVREEAVAVLARSPETVPTVWRQLLRPTTEDFETEWASLHERSMLRVALGRDGLMSTIQSTLPELSVGELLALSDAASGAPPSFEDVVVAHLARHADPRVRAAALSAWSRWPDVPSETSSLLRDPVDSVRLAAASLVHDQGVETWRDEAQRALASVLSSDDAELRAEAVRTLAYDGLPLPGVPHETVERLADDLFLDHWATPWTADVLMRCDGGVRELERVLRPQLGTEFDPDEHGLAVVDALEVMGAAALPLRDAIAAVTAKGERRCYSQLQQILDVIDGDPIAYVIRLGPGWGDEAARVLALGPDGPRAAVLHLGLLVDGAPSVGGRPPLHDVVSPALDAAAIVAASVHDGPHAVAWRRGAARALSRLPASQSVPLLEQLCRDTDAGVRHDAVASLGIVARQSPEAINLAVIAAALGDPATTRAALRVAGVMGSTASELSPQLRRVASEGTAVARLEAALLIARLTGDADDAADLVRAVLRDPRSAAWEPGGVWEIRGRTFWMEVRDLFLDAAARESDVALFVNARFVPVLAWAPIVARLGAAAAPAVPRMRRILAAEAESDERRPFGDPGPSVESVARALAAIGPAAVPALPDLRRAASVHGDSRGVLREAIRSLESL